MSPQEVTYWLVIASIGATVITGLVLWFHEAFREEGAEELRVIANLIPYVAWFAILGTLGSRQAVNLGNPLHLYYMHILAVGTGASFAYIILMFNMYEEHKDDVLPALLVPVIGTAALFIATICQGGYLCSL